MRTMLKEDFKILTSQYKMYVIMLVFFLCAGSISTSDEFFSTFPLVVCSWFTANLILYGENQGLIPSDKKLYVMEKYVFQLIVVGTSFAICFAGLTQRYTVGAADFCNILLMMLAMTLLVPSITLPIIFKNSAQKSVLKYMGVLIAAVALCYYFSAAFEHRYIAQFGLGLCIMAAVLFLALYFVSFKLSLKYFEKREL